MFVMDNIFFESAALGIDMILFGVFYKLYRVKAQNVSTVKAAPVLEIDNSLQNALKEKDGSIRYAAVTGTVKALSTAMRSQYMPNVKGVIRERVTIERKIRWSPMLRLWTTVDNAIQKFQNTVPFVLVGRTSGWFKEISVEVLDPLTADELNLTTVYDHFSSREDTLGEAVVGWVRGERVTGIQEIEGMLTEGSVVTGIGQLVIDNNTIKLKPPESGLTYFLTTMSLDSVIKKLNEQAKLYKSISVVLGCAGTLLALNILLKLYRTYSQKREIAKLRDLQREASRNRRLAAQNRSNQNIDENQRVPLCVVCWTNPVEVLILECGHTCICLNCSERIHDRCPVCRSNIVRTVPAYLP